MEAIAGERIEFVIDFGKGSRLQRRNSVQGGGNEGNASFLDG